MILQQFIDDGMHTVPLLGVLRRLETGKKSLVKFEVNWKQKYKDTRNTKATKLGGVLTGKISDLIAIDCDNERTYQVFKALDPDYKVHLVSKGKPEGGGTILYRYNSDLNTFVLSDSVFKLDFYADDGFIYLATEDNLSKEPWPFDELPEIKKVPDTIKTLLLTLTKKQTLANPDVAPNSTVISNRLAPMVSEFLTKGEYHPVLFKIITPRGFRELPSYVRKGHLHPDDVPEGRGSEYMSKISAILGADISISKELYLNTMISINRLWKTPIEVKRFKSTIINPMVEEKVVIDGKVIWQYDKYWEKMGLIATAMNGEYIESFFDDIKGLYYLVNYSAPYVKVFTDKRGCITTLRTLAGRGLTESQYDTTKQLIRTKLDPSKEFGHLENTDMFNLFRQTPELDVLNFPETYAKQYTRPNNILNFFDTLIPDDYMRAYTLSFIRTKFTTFKYSPVVLYLIGAHGSGKDTFVGLLGAIMGSSYISRPDARVFLEQYNGWIMDKYFIQLDEYGDKLSRASDKQEALGKIKSYSGSKEVQIRAMRQDGFNYSHSFTIILTANRNPLPLEIQDRRIAFLKTPHKLDKQDWVISSGGVSDVVDNIYSEVMDFCYYLATEVKNLSSDSYVVAPETDEKQDMILDSMPTYQQIIHYITNCNFDKLEDMFIESNIVGYSDGWKTGRLLHSKVMELYDVLTEGRGQSSTLIRTFKDAGMPRSHTTRKGQNVFFYHILELSKYVPKGAEFKEYSKGDFSGKKIKGL